MWSLRDIQGELERIAKRDWTEPDAHNSIMAALDFLGQLAHAQRAITLGWHTGADYRTDRGEAMAEVVLALCEYASAAGVDLEHEVLERVRVRRAFGEWPARGAVPQPVAERASNGRGGSGARVKRSD